MDVSLPIVTADNKTSGSICHPPYCSCPSPSLNCMAFVVVLPPPLPPPPRVQCHLLPPPSARPPKSDYSPSLRPTVEAGCLESGECPSMPFMPPEMSTLCPPTHSKVFILSLSTAPHPSLSPPSPLPSSGMQQLLCELVPEVSFPLLPFLPSLLLFFFPL